MQSQREVKRFFKREKREQQHREQVAAAEANAFQMPRSALGALLKQLFYSCGNIGVSRAR